MRALGMGDIGILVCDYCEAKIITIIMIIGLAVPILKTVYACVKLSTNVCLNIVNLS